MENNCLGALKGAVIGFAAGFVTGAVTALFLTTKTGEELREEVKTAVNDIRNGYRSLEPWLSEKCLFRPPYGKLTRQTRLEIESRDAKIGWWTVDSGDTWPSRPTIDSIVTKVLASGGGVVLMHDFERMSDTAEAVHEYVLSLTEALITGARNQGLDIYGLSEVMDCDSSNR